MFNFHKLATFYSTLVMIFIGGAFVREPNLLLDAFGVLPVQDQSTLSLEGMDPVYKFAYHLGFASHLVVGLVGLYAIWHNTTIHRRFALLVFGAHQAMFVWAGWNCMPVRWQQAFLLPAQMNTLLALLLFVIWESEPKITSLKRRKLRDDKKD